MAKRKEVKEKVYCCKCKHIGTIGFVHRDNTPCMHERSKRQHWIKGDAMSPERCYYFQLRCMDVNKNKDCQYYEPFKIVIESVDVSKKWYKFWK